MIPKKEFSIKYKSEIFQVFFRQRIGSLRELRLREERLKTL